MASHGVKIRDNGYGALMKRMADAAKARGVTVGIHEEEGAEPEGDTGATVAEVAAIHELGLGDAEERSFIRAYVDQNEEQLNDDLRKIGDAVIRGTVGTPEQALDRFGLHVVGGIQRFISDGQVTPEDKPVTIARKGSSTTLIDTGVLRSKITHRIVK